MILTDRKLKEMGFTSYNVGDLTYFINVEKDIKLERIYCGYLNPRKHKVIKTVKDLMKLFVFLFVVSFSFSQTTISSGDWSNGAIWDTGVPPTLQAGVNLSDDVTISAGHNVTYNGDLTIKNGASLTVDGSLTISNAGLVDFQLGSTVLVHGTLELNGLTNSNNSKNVSIHGSLIVNGDYSAGNGSTIDGGGSMSVSGTSSGSGTTFGVVLGCDDCSVSSGGMIEDCIVDGNQTAEHAPIEPYWAWTYSQQIYLQSEINNDGNITSLSFEFNGWSSFTDDIEVYMGSVSKSSFSSTSDWVDISELTLVYDGPYSVSNTEGWCSITLDVPYYYDNIDNLVIAVYEKSAGYHSPSDEFYTGDGVTYRVLTYYDDYTNPDPSNPPTADYRSVWIPSLKLKIEPAGSPLSITSFTGVASCDRVELKWIVVTDDGYYTVWRSVDGYLWDVITMTTKDSYTDRGFYNGINYYNLSQTDPDGSTEFFGIISVDAYCSDNIFKIFDLLGREIDENYTGPRIILLKNGQTIKKFF